jgi:hypothetical protein
MPPLLVVGGVFDTAAGLACNRIAAGNGIWWRPLGSGLSQSVSPGIYEPAVYGLCEFRGRLIAGGTFGTAGGTPARGIAAWDGNEWHPLGSGVNGAVVALAVFDDSLIVAGQFTEAGGVPCKNIARWDGSSWSAMATSMTSFSEGTSANALLVRGDTLIVGGYFTGIDGIPAKNLAAWDGADWAEVGGGVGIGGEVVYCLATFGDEMVVGGYFTRAGGIPCRSVVAWNGSGWNSLGSGLTRNLNPSSAQSLAVVGDRLYIGGGFSSVDAVLCDGIAAWDGIKWSPLSTGLASETSVDRRGVGATIVGYQGRVGVGGSFHSAGGVQSARFATWCSPSGPFVTSVLAPGTFCPGRPATLAALVDGAGPFRYQWMRDGVPLTDTPGRYANTDSATLTLVSPTTSDEGTYWCRVDGNCFSDVTDTVTVRLRHCSYDSCPADYDGSGGTPDASDIAAFFADWLTGAECADADCSGGTPDSTDIETFFAAWLAGGC